MRRRGATVAGSVWLIWLLAAEGDRLKQDKTIVYMHSGEFAWSWMSVCHGVTIDGVERRCVVEGEFKPLALCYWVPHCCETRMWDRWTVIHQQLCRNMCRSAHRA